MNSKMKKMVVLQNSTTALCMPHAACAQSDELSGSMSQLYNVAQQHNATLQRCQTAINIAVIAGHHLNTPSPSKCFPSIRASTIGM